MSYVDRIDFGVATCPEVVEDAWAIADGLPDALEELRKASDSMSGVRFARSDDVAVTRCS